MPSAIVKSDGWSPILRAPAMHIRSWEISYDKSLYLMLLGKIALLALAFVRFG